MYTSMFVFRLFVVCNLKVIKIKWKIMLDLATYQEFFVCWRTHICIITRFVGVAIIIVITDRSASFLWTCWSSNDGICIWKNIDSSRCRVCGEGLCKKCIVGSLRRRIVHFGGMLSVWELHVRRPRKIH